MNEVLPDIAVASYFDGDVVPTFDDAAWMKCAPVPIARYWSGADAPSARQAEARVLWTDDALYVRFYGRQDEPLIVNDTPQTDGKTLGLWNRDVCEIFVAPFADEPHTYFEFEVAPTGEWVDLKVEWSPHERRTDWDYASGILVETRIETGAVTMMMRVRWKKAFGVSRPQVDDEWRANFFRCVGADKADGANDDDGRGYLAWQPTYTAKPGFHVPQAFGRLRFVD